MLSTALALSLALSAAISVHQPAQKLPENVQKDQDVVNEHLKKINGTNGQTVWLESEALTKAFPKHTFFAVRFRQYPVARELPEGLAASNIFVVHDNKVEHLKDNKALTAFYHANLAAVTKDTVPTALSSYLTLSQEFIQDGFYAFEIDAKGFTESKDLRDAQGRAIAMKGGNGEIKVDMKLDEKGKVTEVVFDSSKLRPGPRPICQATKLLDADTIVRRMAEQDLLYMGLAARDYVMEQRAAASPELRQAIDRLWARIVKNGW